MDILQQEKKDLNETYQSKIQTMIKDKEDMAAAFSHIEGKLQKVEMDREQLKLLSNQQVQQIESQTKQVKDFEDKLAQSANDHESTKNDLKKANTALMSAKKDAAEQISELEEQ